MVLLYFIIKVIPMENYPTMDAILNFISDFMVFFKSVN